MSTALLHRANSQLQIHRIWFRSFLTTAHQPSRTAECSIPRIPSSPTARTHRRRRPSCQHGPTAFPCRAFGNAASPARGRPYKRPAKDRLKAQEGIEEPVTEIKQLKEAAQDLKIKDLNKIYDVLSKRNDLSLVPISLLSHQLVRGARSEKLKSSAKRNIRFIDDLFVFAMRLIRQIQAGRIRLDSKDRYTKMNLLELFIVTGKYREGVEFWNWLRRQPDKGWLEPSVAGMAIVLLTHSEASLSEMIELYEVVLNDSPTPFASYHLSHNAIIPDRARLFDAYLPLSLVAGMIKARVSYGDMNNAYMYLDTVCRVNPDKTRTGCFLPFIEERPLSEAFTVFTMAGRCGTKMPDGTFRNLLVAFRQHMDRDEPRKVMAFLRGMISATHSFLRFQIRQRSFAPTEIIIAMCQIMQLHGVSNLTQAVQKSLAERVTELTYETLDAFAAHEMRPSVAAYNSMISNLGGREGSREMLLNTMVRMQDDGCRPTFITYRSLLTAAGTSGDKDLVTRVWKTLVGMRLDSNTTPDAIDLNILIQAAHRSDHIAYAEQQVDGLKEHFSPEQLDYMRTSLASKEIKKDRQIPPSPTPLDTDWLFAETDKVMADVKVFRQAAEQMVPTDESNRVPAPMTFLRPREPTLLEAEMRKLYDEFTLEPKPLEEGPNPPVADDTPQHSNTTAAAARSSTNIPLDVLRYENWKTINYLLEESDVEIPAYGKAVDKAIASRVPPPARRGLLHLRREEGIESYGLSDVALSMTRSPEDGDDAAVDEANLERRIYKGRRKIKSLRGVSVHDELAPK